ncbi:MAG: hypothetical protein HHJ17_13105 [Rhodoferax sp.]|uniref:hypothetical protein n=1 Tax=Rhodoferax sp. TaxID=50421 RepID=UPI00185932E9|nr:hypothetical protein [Rhodoferax sp.]NMM14453.1 hypothetical protein [Rhodoferax sp.]NMM18839.1 hypothetical protein [Rhodoferax sp.]
MSATKGNWALFISKEACGWSGELATEETNMKCWETVMGGSSERKFYLIALVKPLNRPASLVKSCSNFGGPNGNFFFVFCLPLTLSYLFYF